MEDLLVDDNVEADQRLIGRQTVHLAWSYVWASRDREEWMAAETSIAEAASDQERIRDVGNKIWAVAAEVLSKGLDRAAFDSELRAQLVGRRPETARELEEVVVLIRMGPALVDLWRHLPPKPIRRLLPDHLLAIGDLVNEAGHGDPETVFILLRAIMARLAAPADFIGQLTDLPLGLNADDRLSMIERLQRVLLSKLTDTAKFAAMTSRDDILNRTDRIADLVKGISAAKDLEFIGSSDALEKLRQTAETIVAGVIDEAAGTVKQGMRDGADASLETQTDTERSLIALRKCQIFAGSVGMDATVLRSLEDIADTVRSKASLAMAELAADPALSDDANGLFDQLYWAVRMLELAGEAKEAERLWRDGMATTSTPVLA